MRSIENPHADNNKVEQGGTMPPEQEANSYTGEVPAQRDRTSSPEYTIPTKEEEEPSRGIGGKVALGVAGVAAAVSVYFWGASSHDGEPKNIPQTGSQPVPTAEQTPGGATVEAPAQTAEKTTETGITINGQMLPKDVAEANYFEVTQSKAPSATAAGDAWATALQNGMRVNVSRTAVSQGGGAEATKQKNLELFTGSDGMLLGLGKDHNKVSSVPTDYMEPGTLVYNFNKDNIDNETTSQVFLTGERVNQDSANSYTILGDLTITTLQGETATKSVTYKAEVHAKLDPKTGKWDYSKSHILKH